MFGNAEITYIW